MITLLPTLLDRDEVWFYCWLPSVLQFIYCQSTLLVLVQHGRKRVIPHNQAAECKIHKLIIQYLMLTTPAVFSFGFCYPIQMAGVFIPVRTNKNNYFTLLNMNLKLITFSFHFSPLLWTSSVQGPLLHNASMLMLWVMELLYGIIISHMSYQIKEPQCLCGGNDYCFN